MRKRPTASQETLKPDPRFGSVLVSKFVNCLMKEGEKSVAYRVFYGAMEMIQDRIKDADPVEVFETAVNHVKPVMEVRPKRVGGQTYQVPMPVKKHRQQSLAIRWRIQAAREKKGRPMAHRLADELCDAYRRQGAAITRRENVHRMAEANKAFAHFAR
ncbi:MAG: 30S ribosomal protein S7 [Planctomycetes bacterium DG_20]|nr:MAG: 30S ribosomal protein S7 [Planctomycetes bacterium DG_20]